VLFFALAHSRWEVVFQPKYAAYLKLIEPWWKVLRSLVLNGHRVERWEEICTAVALTATPSSGGAEGVTNHDASQALPQCR
jgi:hypothetical protein